MLKLIILTGPNRGARFKFGEGDVAIGRHESNEVVLSSSRISKQHCVLRSEGGKVVLRDVGSSNGTFVNGVLVTEKTLRTGDRISVGEYVLEIHLPRGSRPVSSSRSRHLGQGHAQFPAPAQGPRSSGMLALAADAGAIQASGGGQVLPFPSAAGNPALSGADPMISNVAAELAQANVMPQDLKGKAIWYFENYVMPIFYGFNLKYEWKYVCAAIFSAFLLLNLMISVQPLMDENREIVLKETARRATFMARQLAERNTPILKAGAETQTDVGPVDTAEGVSLAMITDLDQRIIAPANKMNQYLASGAEARVANHFSALVQKKGRETGTVDVVDDLVIAVEPIKLFNPQSGKNAVVAMAIVSVDGSDATLGVGAVATVYSHTLLLTGLLGALMLFVLYRLTLKPYQILNEDMDKALKGDLQAVTHEFKCEELNPLWDLINSAIQRIPRHSSRGEGGGGAAEQETVPPEQFIGPTRALAEQLQAGLLVFGGDRKVAFLSAEFESLTGIRPDEAIGQDFSAVARDQSMEGLVRDLLDQCSPGGDPVSQEYEFKGVPCTVQALAFGAPGELAAKAFAILVKRKEE